MKRIHFPDIEVETWEKMTKFLQPGSFAYKSLEEIAEVLRFYDKYEFRDGVDMCDKVISNFFTDYQLQFLDGVPLVAELSFQLNLPSKPLAMEWAKTNMLSFHMDKEDLLRKVFPLIENDDQILAALVFTVRGRHSKDMTVDELRQVAKADSFFGEYIRCCSQIGEIDAILKLSGVKSVAVETSGGRRISLEKEYNPLVGRDYDTDMPHRGGAMRYIWVPRRGDRDRIHRLEAKDVFDVFGHVWEISCLVNSEDEDDEGDHGDNQDNKDRRQVLYRWNVATAV